MRFVATKFGRRVAVHLEDTGELLLPAKLSSLLQTEESLQKAMEQQYLLIYKGIGPHRNYLFNFVRE